ncbi:hypothetical protein B0H14DRAFT_2586503 [Mycena olivaceomarginata]|nr:hypothetical protein B0H14DRAFT_2586503 [Mycena olivaceomarginata]
MGILFQNTPNGWVNFLQGRRASGSGGRRAVGSRRAVGDGQRETAGSDDKSSSSVGMQTAYSEQNVGEVQASRLPQVRVARRSHGAGVKVRKKCCGEGKKDRTEWYRF